MKKFLLVLCVALLLTAVCTSAMAWVSDPTLKSGGKSLSDYDATSTYNGHYVKDVVILTMPSCTTPGSARIDTYYTEYDPVTETYTITTDPGPSSVVSIDATHKYHSTGDPYDGDQGWETIEASDCTKITQKRVCDVCGASETRTRSISANHTFVVKAVPGKEPTCTSKGWAQSVCSVCGAVNPANPNPFETDKIDHVYSVKVTDKAETCETEGKGHWECEFCGKAKPGLDGKTEYFTIPAHTFTAASKEVIDEPATCFKPGKSHKVCALCGLSEKAGGVVVYNTIPQLTHEYGNWVTKKAASCVDGLEQRVCGLCGNVETRTIPKNDEHTWVEFFKNTGNCTKGADGRAQEVVQEKWRRCAVCGLEEYLTDEATMSLHQFVADTSKSASNIPPECGASNPSAKEGIEYLKCVSCGGTYERKVPVLTEHKWGAWVCTVAPGTDGTKNGVWERTCTNYHCIEKQTYVGTTAPEGGSTPSDKPTTSPTTPSGSENYKITSWAFTGSSVSGSVAGNVSYRTPGLSVNVIIYTPTGTFLSVNAPVDEDGHFSVSAGGAVYAVSVQLKDNSKTYQTDGKYV